MPTFLAIETSCDDTSVAVTQKTRNMFRVLSHSRASQADVHTHTKGVVPEVAAREHASVMMPVVEEVMRKARVKPAAIDCIAVTEGPGLLTSLFVGVETARALGYAWGKPVVGVHHLWGHFVSGLLSTKGQTTGNKGRAVVSGQPIAFNLSLWRQPTLALIVSGGHTEFLVYNGKSIRRIGATLDDAAGESFDKVAVMLGLGYPGGPEISRLATTCKEDMFTFPRPLLNKKNFDFSFSGLKTAVRYTLEDMEQVLGVDKKTASSARIRKKYGPCIARAFQEAVVETLVTKADRAIEEYKPKSFFIGGGVSANGRLRERMRTLSEKYPRIEFAIPQMEYTQDNAVMIGLAAHLSSTKPKKGDWKKLKAYARGKVTS